MRSFRLADRLHCKETAAVDEAGFGSRIARRSRAHYRDAAILEARPRRADRAWPRLRASDRATADFGAGPGGGAAAAGDQQLGISDHRSADDPLAFRTSTAICAAASPSAISTPSATTGDHACAARRVSTRCALATSSSKRRSPRSSQPSSAIRSSSPSTTARSSSSRAGRTRTHQASKPSRRTAIQRPNPFREPPL